MGEWKQKAKKLEWHSVERMYLRQRCFDGSLAQSIKPLYRCVKFHGNLSITSSDIPLKLKKFGVNLVPGSELWSGSGSKPNQFDQVPAAIDTLNLIEIRPTSSDIPLKCKNPVPGSGLWSGSGSKVNQFVHITTSVDTQHFIQIHARVFE